MLIVCHQMLLLTSGHSWHLRHGLKGDRWHHVVREPPSIEGRMCGSQGVTGTVTHTALLFIKSFSCLSSHLLRRVSACVRHWSGLPFSFSGLMSVARHEVSPSVSPDPFLPQSFFLVSTVMGTQTPGFHGSYDEMSWLHERGGVNICCATLAL